MNSVIRTILLASSLSLACFASAESLKAHVTSMTSKIVAPMKKLDAPGFEKVLKPMVTKTFKHTEDGVTTDFTAMMKGVKQGFGMLSKATEVNYKVLKVTEAGNKGTVLMSSKVAGVLKSGSDKTAKPINVGVTGNITYSFVKESGKWKLDSMVWGKVKYTMNGKEIQPNSPPPKMASPKAANP